jgi:hypothetical protein
VDSCRESWRFAFGEEKRILHFAYPTNACVRGVPRCCVQDDTALEMRPYPRSRRRFIAFPGLRSETWGTRHAEVMLEDKSRSFAPLRTTWALLVCAFIPADR